MESKFIIVLFKNKKKRKIIKRYDTEKKAIEKYNSLLKLNNNIIFEKLIENAEETNYELGLITNQKKIQESLFLTDELGRNNVVNLENPDYVFTKISKFKIEELIYDWQKSKKISFKQFISEYCKVKDLKNIFSLNNKICVQIDEDVMVFSLKDSSESHRLIEVLEDYFYQNNRGDAIFVKDVSSAQRKWIYDVLSKKGFDKKRLYRLKTTFSKR
jgi:hypothetical protein